MKDVEVKSIATGYGNILSNKGGIGISFEINNNAFLFINSHLSRN